MRPQEIIEKKRDGGELSTEEVHEFIDGVCDSSWADYQTSALLMAMFIRGLSEAETDALVSSMLHSGEVLDFSQIDAPKADKHSTGGVGDKTSLIIAPLVAACGVTVPMISGRALGHTGGTLDKLESIPGYNVRLSTDEFQSVIRKCGFAMAGQTAEIAPADKKLYSLRDATGTVPYIPLIVASIMSKKLAEGLDALVLDVKTGSGAFMHSAEDSERLARSLVSAGNSFGVRTEAIVSDMGQPLGKFVGNAYEVYESLIIMRGEADRMMQPTLDLAIELSARMLVLTSISNDVEAARELALSKIANGEALEHFRQNIELQGGDPAICDSPGNILNDRLYAGPVRAVKSGYVTEIDTTAIGNALVTVGGGRTRADDLIDHAVGFENIARIGDEVREGEDLSILYARRETDHRSVLDILQGSYVLSETRPRIPDLISAVIVDRD